jgi:NADPH2:quinone reductase
MELKDDIAIPHATQPGQLIVQVKATTVIRDSLTWEDLYSDPPAHMGNDFSGVVVETYSPDQDLKVGNEVYGMTSAHRGGTWAEYATATSDEAYPKPNHLSWEEAAALPLSALTTGQALFSSPDFEARSDPRSIRRCGHASCPVRSNCRISNRCRQQLESSK